MKRQPPAPPAVTERFIEVGGVRVRLLESGSGRTPFLLLHGLGASATKWRAVLPLLGRRSLAPDLPGFGRSGAPRARYTLGWLAGGVRATMDFAGIERAHLVGNSLGGMVALWLAAAWPERAASLALMAPALPAAPGVRPEPRVLARFLAPLLPGVGETLLAGVTRFRTPERIVGESLAVNCADSARVPPEIVEALVAEAAERRGRPGLRRAMLSSQRSLARVMVARHERVRGVAAAVRAPMLLLWGSEDRLVPRAVGEHWAREIPGAELQVLDGAGHNPQLEAPERVAGCLRAFAERAGDADG
ncbi:MAG: alpha/beta fold hydrolase [Acidobacteria bacterium]|nr:alpha/beta fold hydrolase [Acidobacteriota bacterium]